MRPAVHTFTDARHTFTARKRTGWIGWRSSASGRVFQTPLCSLLRSRSFSIGTPGRSEIVVGTSAPCRTQPRMETSRRPGGQSRGAPKPVEGKPLRSTSLLEQVNERVNGGTALPGHAIRQARSRLEARQGYESDGAVRCAVSVSKIDEPDSRHGRLPGRSVIDTNFRLRQVRPARVRFGEPRTACGATSCTTPISTMPPLIDRMMRHFEAVLAAAVSGS